MFLTIVDRLPADFLSSKNLYMAEPPVRVESPTGSNAAQLSDASRARVIRSPGEINLVPYGNRSVIKIAGTQVVHILCAHMYVVLQLLDVVNIDRLPRSSAGQPV